MPISSPDRPFIYRFDGFELDPGRFELRADGTPRHVEPQVLSLLILLAANAGRMVGKDEVIEKVWGGRIVSEAAVASRIKAARKALGDDGKRQAYIRTVHGTGFRFDGRVETIPAPLAAQAVELPPSAPLPDARPSIAVLPFHVTGEPGPLAFVADALADELIADLSRLRWLLVIARATTFRFRGPAVDGAAVGSALKVRYCLTGTLEEVRGHIVLSVQLARTLDSAVVWAERFTAGTDELHALRRHILAALVTNVESRIVQNEVDLARRMPVATLDAWSSYHLGLDHMFRFSRPDNAVAAHLFEQALERDPHFSRALSGLSFTAWQDCFLHYSGQREEMAHKARAMADQALRCDPLDPFAHLNLGRSLWFEDAIALSIDTLSHCIDLSPNYAQAVYSRSWAEMTLCDGAASDGNAALALRLSPLDPLRYAFLAVRSVSALLLEDHAGAVAWGEKAARTPGAHKHVVLIAALANHVAGRRDNAAQWVATARGLDAQVSPASFLQAFPFAASTGREVIERALRDMFA
ncbi:MAG TPA: winged helix-turn-helix domain-containing protein [Novosphingobium sp.]|nr:winged helix-turn-helix domain-containing protein [Novosphingobium sp.]